MRRDILKKSILTYVAIGWTRTSMDKMFSEQQVLHKRAFNAQKCLTHFHQVNMRLERLHIIKTKESEKKATTNMKHDELV
jgi:hypothetical protein